MTTDRYVAELNCFSNADIAQIFKVSEAAVEAWKRGENLWEPDWYRDTLARILNEKGTPVS